MTLVWFRFRQNRVWAAGEILEEDFGPAAGCLHRINSSQCTSTVVQVSREKFTSLFHHDLYSGNFPYIVKQGFNGPSEGSMWCSFVFLMFLHNPIPSSMYVRGFKCTSTLGFLDIYFDVFLWKALKTIDILMMTWGHHTCPFFASLLLTNKSLTRFLKSFRSETSPSIGVAASW